MASTTFSGPIKAGTIANTTGTTLGDNVKNVGQVGMTQSSDVALTHATTTATALGIIIPANSQIINIDIVVEAVFTGSSTTTIAIGNATGTPTNIGAAHNVSATAVGPLKCYKLQLELGITSVLVILNFLVSQLLTLQVQEKQELLLHTHKIII